MTPPFTHTAPTFRLADIVQAVLPQLGGLTEEQRRALHAIADCRSGVYGERLLQCDDCAQSLRSPRSCGHRSCPRCQYAAASVWLARQQRKLVPVPYFMATFTLPDGLRAIARQQPAVVYDAMFHAAAETLQSFGRRHRDLRAALGFCAVLHTHSRRLDYHPHLHVVIPGGGIDGRRQWRTLRGKYLFNGRALATVFRAKLRDALTAAGVVLSTDLPRRWVVHCTRVGSGLPALKYLSRYLYRGVIAEQQIVAVDHDARTVTFRYQNGKTKQSALRTLGFVEFVRLLVQHVLPKGFRRARDYGFLHHNAKRLIAALQWVLRVVLPPPITAVVRSFRCPQCHGPMRVIGVTTRLRVT